MATSSIPMGFESRFPNNTYTDANAMENVFYPCIFRTTAAAANTPVSGHVFTIIQVATSTGYASQLAIPRDELKLYMRQKTAGTWSEWASIEMGGVIQRLKSLLTLPVRRAVAL